jgi:hypothetical protein
VQSANNKGNVAELAIATEAARLGISVLKPLTEHERYDLAFDLGSEVMRVQCKWGGVKGDVINVSTVGSYHSPTKGYVRLTYASTEIDAIAVYSGEVDRCYLLPIALLEHQTQVFLRLSKPKNNQRAALNWAADYEFGAIAQREERLRGTQEVAGSSPASSISQQAARTLLSFPDSDDFADLKRPVGMDEFYAKLAQYVRLAEAGEEISVTRWGRPVARLGPP